MRIVLSIKRACYYYPRRRCARWLLSTLTTTFSIMDLSKTLPPCPSLDARTPTRRVPCRSPFNQSQSRASTSSDSSVPGLVEDPPCWSGSDTTVEDQQLLDSEVWDSYFWSQEKKDLRSLIYQTEPTALSPFGHESYLSPFNRNFTSSNLSGLNVNEVPAELHRSDAIRTARQTPKPLPHNTYSPFPPVSTIETYNTAPWPLRSDSQPQSQSQSENPQRPALRSQAHTTPSKYTPPA